ncbi:S8 family serine peptidase [Streptomyces lycii]|uniref:S8 family serine peptidase n=1 Tax=Streptomyces lycii TaxID=2654337 RepID=A0ABQ7FS39_9ACTN|nr:S8 family serine peptidase [Streptomyces lycii]KAF4410452.1 S8 family serine peptidase [Streptomyces lycii]
MRIRHGQRQRLLTAVLTAALVFGTATQAGGAPRTGDGAATEPQLAADSGTGGHGTAGSGKAGSDTADSGTAGRDTAARDTAGPGARGGTGAGSGSPGTGPGGAEGPGGEPGAASGGAPRTVTLITGDRVVVDGSGRRVTDVLPGPGREGIPIRVRSAREGTYAVPADARQLVDRGKLDRRLFDVTGLVRDGYDDANRAGLPLIVAYTGGRGPGARTGAAAATRAGLTAAGASVHRSLPVIGADAVRAPRKDRAALWDALTAAPAADSAFRTAADGVERVWLDARVGAAIDRSVARIGTPDAWKDGYDGTGVKVAVLDTGVDETHPDLAGVEIGQRDFSEAPDAVDRSGHGTHVASTVAGSGAASGGAYRGVAPGARILDGKVLDDTGNGYTSDIVAGMEWAAGQGARVVNLSLGLFDTPETDPLEETVNTLSAERGVLFVVAAGNEGPSGRSVRTPGSAESALTVGAVDRDDALVDFSSAGPTLAGSLKPDLTAPGAGIVAAKAAEGVEGTAPPGQGGEGRYVEMSGTSMAAPHVAGAAAVLAQRRPDLTGDQLKRLLVASAAPGDPDAPAYEQGTGRVDVARAYRQSVVSEQTAVDFGLLESPHDTDEPVTRQLTYRNDGAEAVTFDLSVEALRPGGEPAPDGMFTLSEDRVTVPAGGTAAVGVIADTRVGDDLSGTFSGSVVARTETAGGQTVRTAVGVELEEEKHTLTVRVRPPGGSAEGGPGSDDGTGDASGGGGDPGDGGDGGGGGGPGDDGGVGDSAGGGSAGDDGEGASAGGDGGDDSGGATDDASDGATDGATDGADDGTDDASGGGGTDGRSAGGAATGAVNVYGRQQGWVPLPADSDGDGTVSVRLPRDDYLVESMLSVPDGDGGSHESVMIRPLITLDRGGTVAFDHGEAKPVAITAPDGAEPRRGFLTYQSGIAVYPQLEIVELDRLRLGHVGPRVAGEEFRTQVGGLWTRGDARYHLLYDRAGAFWDGFEHRVSADELATVETAVGAPASGKTATTTAQWTDTRDGAGNGAGGGPASVQLPSGEDLALPGTVRNHFTAPEGFTWSLTAAQYGAEGGWEAEFTGRPAVYRPGETYRETFNTGVFGPGIGAEGDNTDRGGRRLGNRMHVCVPVLVDGAGHVGRGRYADARSTVTANGGTVAETAAPQCSSFAVAAEEAEYRVAVEATRRAGDSAVSGSVSAEWTYRSARTEGREWAPLPLSAVRFAPRLAPDSSAAAGERMTVPLTVEGPAARDGYRALEVRVSYDRGATWRDAPVLGGDGTGGSGPDSGGDGDTGDGDTGDGDTGGGGGRAGDGAGAGEGRAGGEHLVLRHPAGTGSVSFAVTLEDREGNTFEATLLDAYLLR